MNVRLLGRETEKRHCTVAFVSLYRIHFFSWWFSLFTEWNLLLLPFFLFFLSFLSLPVSCSSLAPIDKAKIPNSKKTISTLSDFPPFCTPSWRTCTSTFALIGQRTNHWMVIGSQITGSTRRKPGSPEPVRLSSPPNLTLWQLQNSSFLRKLSFHIGRRQGTHLRGAIYSELIPTLGLASSRA